MMYSKSALLLAFTAGAAGMSQEFMDALAAQAKQDQLNGVGANGGGATGGGATGGGATGGGGGIIPDIVNSPAVGVYMDLPVQLNGQDRCAMINIAMDESGSMQREQRFLKEYAIPRLSNLLYSKEYDYDHVFFCTNGFGWKHAPAADQYFRHIGCSTGVKTTLKSTGLAHDDITDFENEKGGQHEDGYHAIVESINHVEKEIRGYANALIDIPSTCATLKNNMILVTDEDRDDLTNNTIGVAEVRAAIAENNYILNEVVNVLLHIPPSQLTIPNSPDLNKEIGVRANYDPDLFNNPTTETVCIDIPLGNGLTFPSCSDQPVYPTNEWFTTNYTTPDLGVWKTELTSVPYDTHMTNGEGDSYQTYMPLIVNTRGALWSIVHLRSSLDANGGVVDQAYAEAWAEAFVDIKVDEIDCTNNCNANPCRAPPCREAELGGDPHFTTWRNEHYEYHGQCDLVMLKDDKFADGLGIDVHIRTKLVRFWSYIKSVAIRIGNDILEIEGSGDIHDARNHYWINFEYQADIDKIGGFPIKHEKFTVNWKRSWTIDLGPKYENQSIVIEIYKEFIRVRFNGGSDSFGTSVGLMGDYYSGKTLARDGHTVLNDFTELGHEWQVMPSEPKLFHELSHPQFPKKCLEPEDPHGERHRRLEESSITIEQAEEACKSLEDPLSRKDCAYDILATQDIDMVGAF